MSNENKKDHAPARDPDLVNSSPLHRAAKRANKHGVPQAMSWYRDGKIVEDWVGKRVASQGRRFLKKTRIGFCPGDTDSGIG